MTGRNRFSLAADQADREFNWMFLCLLSTPRMIVRRDFYEWPTSEINESGASLQPGLSSSKLYL